VFIAETLQRGSRERVLLAANSFHFGKESVGI
jgi:hypothetical protein